MNYLVISTHKNPCRAFWGRVPPIAPEEALSPRPKYDRTDFHSAMRAPSRFARDVGQALRTRPEGGLSESQSSGRHDHHVVDRGPDQQERHYRIDEVAIKELTAVDAE